MSAERPTGEMDEYESAIARATLLWMSTPKERADYAKKYPREMGQAAAYLSTIFTPEELQDFSPNITEPTSLPKPTPQTVSGSGSGRFSSIRKFAARTPFIRRFIRS